MPDQLVAGAVGDLVLIIPAGAIVAMVWAAVEIWKRRSSQNGGSAGRS